MENRAGVPDTPAAALATEQIRDNLYLIRGGGRTIQVNGKDLPTAGTSAVLVTDRGVVLVDTKLPGWSAPLLETIRSITDRPLTAIVNTHPHMDHVGGNPELADRGKVEIIAHEITAELMNGASGLEYPRTIASALPAMAGVQTVITGHYHRVLELTDLETYGVFVRRFVEAVQAAKRGRATIEEFVGSWRIPDRFLDRRKPLTLLPFSGKIAGIR
jgi:glyoxylase-like metal-dependent hydrolase (beta-lactamase superfamily II)